MALDKLRRRKLEFAIRDEEISTEAIEEPIKRFSVMDQRKYVQKVLFG